MVRDVMMESGNLRMVGSPFLPVRASEVSLDPGYYDDLGRPGERASALPSIESSVVTGPFLRLFIPYRPSQFDPRILERCPELEPVGGGSLRLVRSSRADSIHAKRVARSRAALACVANLWSITLDGGAMEVDPVFAPIRSRGCGGSST